MEILQAQHKDLDALVEMGGDFFVEAGWQEPLKWDPERARESLTGLLEDEQAVILVAKNQEQYVGMVGALVYPVWYNTSILTGQEFFWYVKPESRGNVGIKLLLELEKIAAQKGAVMFEMMSMQSMPSLDAVYSRFGYKPSEKTFMKRL